MTDITRDTAHITELGAQPNPEAAISVRGLVKRFGDFAAVDGIDFDVARGEIFGFLGPNGAGKTTAIRILTGTIAPSAGTALVLGTDVVREPEIAKRRIGYMSQKFALFDDLTVDENLRFYAGVYDLSAERFAEQRRYVLEMADLVGREDELTRNLSVGWKQRLALGTATIHEPELLFLDEPTSGVDPVARRHFWDLLYDLAGRGVTLFVTTHYMDEASHCNRLAFIYRGRLIAEGTPTEIRTDCMTQRILEVAAADTAGVLEWLDAADGIGEAYLSGAVLHAVTDSEPGTPERGPGYATDAQGPTEAPEGATEATALQSRLRDAGFADADVVWVQPTIEDVFVNLVSTQREEG